MTDDKPRQIIINLPYSCYDCGFHYYSSGFNNNGPDYPSKYRCALCNKTIAIEKFILKKPSCINSITQIINKEIREWEMIFCDDETIYNGNVPSWCPGKLLNFSNGIYI